MSDLVSIDYPRNYIVAGDLDGKEVTLTIDRVADKNTVRREDGTLIDKWVIYFKEAKKPFILGDPNAKLAQIELGNDKRKWPGKTITIFPTTTLTSRAFAEQAGCVIKGEKKGKVIVPCIRIKISGGEPAVIRSQMAEVGGQKQEGEPEW
jgi:hypothetical protein